MLPKESLGTSSRPHGFLGQTSSILARSAANGHDDEDDEALVFVIELGSYNDLGLKKEANVNLSH